MDFRPRPKPKRSSRPAGASAKPRRPFWLFHLPRFLARLMVYGLLALAVLLVFVWFYPWSFSFIDRRVRERWREATGVELHYRKATFRLSGGSIVIREPELVDPKSGRTLLDLDRVRIQMPIGQFFFSKPPYLIDAIAVHGPMALVASREDGKLSLEPRWERLFALVRERLARRARGSKAEEKNFGLRHLRVDTVTLGLFANAAGRRRPLAQLNNAALDADFPETLEPSQITVSGQFNAHDAAHALVLSIRPDLARQSAEFNLRLNNFFSREDLPWPLPVELRARALESTGRGAFKDGRWRLSGTSNLAGIDLIGIDALADHALGPARLAWNLGFDPAAGRLAVEAFKLDNRLCTLETSGTLSTQAPFPYQLRVAGLRLQGQALGMIAAKLGRGNQIVRPSEAALELEGSLRGNLDERRPAAVQGALRVSGLNLNPPNLPPLSNLKLQAELSTRTLTLTEASGVVQGIPVLLKGELKGDVLAGEVAAADVSWKGGGSLAQLVAIVKDQLKNTSASQALSDLTLSGRIDGEGRVRFSEPRAGERAAALDRTRLEGEIKIHDAQVETPRLPEPIKKLEGTVRFTSATARLERGSGELNGQPFDLDGSMQGERFFWKNPALMLHGRLAADLATLRERVSASDPQLKQSLAALPELRGAGRLEATLSAEAGRLGQARVEGTLGLREVVTRLDSDLVNGPLTLSAAELKFDNDQVVIKRAAGSLGEVGFSVTGAVRPTSATLEASFDGELKEIKARIPPALGFFWVGGRARASNTLRIEPRPGFTPPADWLSWRAALAETRPANGDWRAWIAQRWRFEGGGAIHLEDAEMTFISMPARLWGINGLVRWDMERLWSPEASPVRGGEKSEDLLGWIELNYGRNLNDILAGAKGGPPVFRFRISGEKLAVAEWLQPWDLSYFDTPLERAHQLEFDSTRTPNFQMFGEFATANATFNKVKGEDFRCKLDLDAYIGQSNKMVWRDISATLYGGTLRIDGVRVRKGIETSLALDHVQLKPLMQALYDEQNVGGIYSGAMTGSVKLHRPWGEPSPPFEGAGEFNIVQSQFVSNRIFQGLAGLLKLPFFNNIVFSNIQGPFTVKEGQMISKRGIDFKNPFLNLRVTGAWGPDKKLDLVLRLQFVPVVGKIPLVGDVLSLLNKLAGQVFQVAVRGTTDKPTLSLLR